MEQRLNRLAQLQMAKANIVTESFSHLVLGADNVPLSCGSVAPEVVSAEEGAQCSAEKHLLDSIRRSVDEGASRSDEHTREEVTGTPIDHGEDSSPTERKKENGINTQTVSWRTCGSNRINVDESLHVNDDRMSEASTDSLSRSVDLHTLDGTAFYVPLTTDSPTEKKPLLFSDDALEGDSNLIERNESARDVPIFSTKQGQTGVLNILRRQNALDPAALDTSALVDILAMAPNTSSSLNENTSIKNEEAKAEDKEPPALLDLLVLEPIFDNFEPEVGGPNDGNNCLENEIPLTTTLGTSFDEPRDKKTHDNISLGSLPPRIEVEDIIPHSPNYLNSRSPLPCRMESPSFYMRTGVQRNTDSDSDTSEDITPLAERKQRKSIPSQVEIDLKKTMEAQKNNYLPQVAFLYEKEDEKMKDHLEQVKASDESFDRAPCMPIERQVHRNHMLNDITDSSTKDAEIPSMDEVQKGDTDLMIAQPILDLTRSTSTGALGEQMGTPEPTVCAKFNDPSEEKGTDTVHPMEHFEHDGRIRFRGLGTKPETTNTDEVTTEQKVDKRTTERRVDIERTDDTGIINEFSDIKFWSPPKTVISDYEINNAADSKPVQSEAINEPSVQRLRKGGVSCTPSSSEDDLHRSKEMVEAEIHTQNVYDFSGFRADQDGQKRKDDLKEFFQALLSRKPDDKDSSQSLGDNGAQSRFIVKVDEIIEVLSPQHGIEDSQTKIDSKIKRLDPESETEHHQFKSPRLTPIHTPILLLSPCVSPPPSDDTPQGGGSRRSRSRSRSPRSKKTRDLSPKDKAAILSRSGSPYSPRPRSRSPSLRRVVVTGSVVQRRSPSPRPVSSHQSRSVSPSCTRIPRPISPFISLRRDPSPVLNNQCQSLAPDQYSSSRRRFPPPGSQTAIGSDSRKAVALFENKAESPRPAVYHQQQENSGIHSPAVKSQGEDISSEGPSHLPSSRVDAIDEITQSINSLSSIFTELSASVEEKAGSVRFESAVPGSEVKTILPNLSVSTLAPESTIPHKTRGRIYDSGRRTEPRSKDEYFKNVKDLQDMVEGNLKLSFESQASRGPRQKLIHKDSKTQNDIISALTKRYLPCLARKFEDVKNNELKNIDFILQDSEFMNALDALRRAPYFVGGALLSNLPHMQEVYQQVVLRPVIFRTFKKLFEVLFHIFTIGEMDDIPQIALVAAGNLFTILINGSDVSEAFSKGVADEPGLLELLVWLVKFMKRNLAMLEIGAQDLLTSCLNILYNCSMHGINRQRLQEVGTVEMCQTFMDASNELIQRVSLLTVAYLADEKQSQIFQAKRKPIEHLLDQLGKLIELGTVRDEEGWTKLELIKGLGRLSINDSNKRVITECGALEVLLQAATVDASGLEKLESLKVIWSLCFDYDTKTLLRNNKAAMEMLEHTADFPLDPKCKKVAEGILWIIRDAETHQTLKGESSCDREHIMISYQWDTKHLAVNLRNFLRVHGYHVWMDIDHMQGSTIETMAKAVEKSAVFLMCMSQKYKESQNCRSEAEYAYYQKKEIIPVVVQNKYKPDGWLGFLRGTKMYYDITSDEHSLKNMTSLLNALGTKGKRDDYTGIQPRSPIPLPAPSPRPPKREKTASRPRTAESPRQWDENKVSSWMVGHDISQRVGPLTGRQISFLHKMRRDAPDFYYSYVTKNLYNIKSAEFNDFSALTSAIEELGLGDAGH